MQNQVISKKGSLGYQGIELKKSYEPCTDRFIHLQRSIVIAFLYHFPQFINMLYKNFKKEHQIQGSMSSSSPSPTAEGKSRKVIEYRESEWNWTNLRRIRKKGKQIQSKSTSWTGGNSRLVLSLDMDRKFIASKKFSNGSSISLLLVNSAEI